MSALGFQRVAWPLKAEAPLVLRSDSSSGTDVLPRLVAKNGMWDSLVVEVVGLIVRELPSRPDGLGSFQLTCKAWKSAASGFVL